MEEFNGRVLALQILVAGLIARVAGERADPVRFLTDFRDEVRAVVLGVAIGGANDERAVRAHALRGVDELMSLMKPPSED